jgi:hypothetical protein
MAAIDMAPATIPATPAINTRAAHSPGSRRAPRLPQYVQAISNRCPEIRAANNPPVKLPD